MRNYVPIQRATNGPTMSLRAVDDKAESVLQCCLWAFAFTLPLESIDLGIMSGSLSLAKIAGYGLAVASLCAFDRCYSHRPFPLWCFAGYLIVLSLQGFRVAEPIELLSDVFTAAQLTILFWIGANLLRDEKTVVGTLWAYSMACAIVSLALSSGHPLVTRTMGAASGARRTLLWEDPNTLAVVLALGALMLIGLALYRRTSVWWINLALLATGIVVLFAIVATGSRTGTAVFLVGAVVLALPAPGSAKLRSLGVGLLSIVAMLSLVLAEPGMNSVSDRRDPSVPEASRRETSAGRWQRALNEGYLSGRREIYARAAEMSLERPILGWGPCDATYELGSRVSRASARGTRGAHNGVLSLLLDVGIVGLLPMLIGVIACGRSSWRARVTRFGMLPAALFLSVVATNMSLTWIDRKPGWIVLALAVALGSSSESKQAPEPGSP